MRGNVTVLGQKIMLTNLCQEIIMTDTELCSLGYNMPKPKYQFSRVKWYTVDIGRGVWKLSQEYNKIIEWCTEQFGPHPNRHDAWSRWWVGVGTMYFRDEKDYVMFLLRWGNDCSYS